MSARSKKKGRLSAPAGYAAAASLSEPLQECLEILHFFQNHRDAEAFLQPVDWKLYGLNDYPEIIKHPMDLSTVEQKLLSNTYKDPNAFIKDMRLIWDNCMTYNRPDSDVYLMADKLKKLFEKKIGKLKSSGEGQVKDEVGATNDKSSMKGPDKSRLSHGDKEVVKEVTRSDRLKFAQCIQQLSPEQLGRLVEMIQNECPMALNEGNGGENSANEEIEIELNTIDDANFNIFFTYVNSCLNGAENGTGSSMKKQKIK
jgi:bromodomain-containing factor 1